MIIKFGNTSGDVFQPANESPLSFGSQELCSAKITEDGIFIFDRETNNETSQLDEEVLIRFIENICEKFSKNNGVRIFLPRINASMFEEAKIQKIIYEIIENVIIISV